MYVSASELFLFEFLRYMEIEDRIAFLKIVNFLHFCHFFLHSERLDLRGFERKRLGQLSGFHFFVIRE